MASKVSTRLLYRHPKTHRLISKEAASKYFKKTKKRIKPEHWLYVTQHFSEEEIAERPERKKRQGRIEQAVRLTRTEKILKLSSLDDRWVSKTLAKHRVYKSLVENWGGEIRVTVNGHSQGRRVKEVIHLAYHRGHWGLGAQREPGQTFAQWARLNEDKYDRFKQWVLGSILSNLRRRGLRVSNPKESAQRLRTLNQKRLDLVDALDGTKPGAARGGLLERMAWATDAIATQKKLKQLNGVTMRIEKLA